MSNSGKHKKVLFFILVSIFVGGVDVCHAGGLFSKIAKQWNKFWRKTGWFPMRYKTNRKIIGPFFIPHNNRVYLTVLAKNNIVRKARAKIGTESNVFSCKLPLKKGYSVLKIDVTDYLGKRYSITPSNVKDGESEKIKGVIPRLPSKRDDFSFFVYGDMRKRDVGLLHKIKKKSKKDETSVAYKTGRIIKREKDAVFHLLTGDLVINGGSVREWIEFLDKVLRPVTRDSFVTSSIGNHDISSSMVTIKKEKYMWLFDKTVPHFGNIFYFDELKGKKGKIKVKKHIEETQGYFNIGPAGFVHLPLPTEGTKHHYLEISFVKSKGAPRRPSIPGAQFSCYNFKEKIYIEFEENIKKAVKDKKAGKIKFIIVYGHAPLVSSPKYEKTIKHEGMINFFIKNDKKFSSKKRPSGVKYRKYLFAKNIERILRKYPIDAYFGGHNHIYDRCTWVIDRETSVPIITIGVGTKLRRLKKGPAVSGGLGEEIKSKKVIHKGIKNKDFIGFVKCRVQSNKGVISCKLIGKYDSGGDISTHDRFEIRAR